MSTKKKTKSITLKHEPLTPEKLREFSGLNLSEEQAEEAISSLTRYARIIFDFTIQQEQSANGKASQTLDDSTERRQ